MNNYSTIAQLLEGVTEVFDLYREFGKRNYIGEGVTQLEHAIQCAEQAAKEFPDSNEIIVGAFLHNIGNLLKIRDNKESLNGLELVKYEEIGSKFLEKMGFSKRITSLGKNKVLAKRYLVTLDPEYLINLSDSSKETFKMQGGILSLEEKRVFETLQDKELFLRMRVWDDKAKSNNFMYNEKRGIGYYEDMACRLIFKD